MSRAATGDGPFLGSGLGLVSQWCVARTVDHVRSAGFDDVGRAHILLFLRPSIHGRRPTAIAETMQVTKQSVNELLGHLEDRGYLTRGVDPADHRARIVRLTRRGRALERAVIDAARHADAELSKMLGAARFRRLRADLDELVRLTGSEAEPR
jgi:DNA-binding MarR family transcriptional regulator